MVCPLTTLKKIIMKRILMLVAMPLVASASYSQTASARGGARSPEDRATMLTNWIDKTVTLTADQKTKVQAVNLKYAKLRKDARDSSTQTNRQGMRQEMMNDNKEQDAELKGILTADQYTAYEAAKKQRIEDMKSRRKRE